MLSIKIYFPLYSVVVPCYLSYALDPIVSFLIEPDGQCHSALLFSSEGKLYISLELALLRPHISNGVFHWHSKENSNSTTWNNKEYFLAYQIKLVQAVWFEKHFGSVHLRSQHHRFPPALYSSNSSLPLYLPSGGHVGCSSFPLVCVFCQNCNEYL